MVDAALTILATMWVLTMLLLAVVVVMIIAYWQIYRKAGQPGWASLIPFYSQYVLFKITWGNGWLFLIPTCLAMVTRYVKVGGFMGMLMWILSLVASVIGILTIWKLAKVFGKGFGFALGLIFLSPIFLCILGFGSARYLGPDDEHMQVS